MTKDQSVADVMAQMMESMPQVEQNVPAQEGEPSQESKRGRKKSIFKETAKISAQVDGKVMEKIRAISAKEGVSIRDIFDTALEMFVKAYEAKHGNIRGMKPKRGDASALV